MSVDYNPVGGIGIEITKSIEKKLVMANEGESNGGCIKEVLEDLDIYYKEGGDGNYSGDQNTYYIMVEGDTLGDISKNAPILLEKLKLLGIKILYKDLIVVEDLLAW